MKAFRVAVMCLVAIVPVAVSAVQAQQVDSRVPQPMREKSFPLGVTYMVVSLNGRALPGERPSVLLDQNFRLRGFAGCNNYSAIAYPQQEQGIAVGPFALTNRSCDRAIMSSEQALLVALRTATRWDTDGHMMTISSPQGEIRLERSL